MQDAVRGSPTPKSPGSAAQALDGDPPASGRSDARSPLVKLTSLEPVAVTAVWPTEPHHFTPWLLANGDLLSRVLGLDVELEAREYKVGKKAKARGWTNASAPAANWWSAALAARTPLLPGAATLAYVDVDSLLRRVYGPGKQGAAFGHAKVGGYHVRLRGLSPLVAAISTPQAAPVVAATRLRGGNAGSARSAASLVKQAIATARAAGATGQILVRGDSAFGSGPVVSACRTAGVNFSLTLQTNPKTHKAIEGIDAPAGMSVRYPGAVSDDDTGRWTSDTEVAETIYTAFE